MVGDVTYLDRIVRQQKQGVAVGIASICSANPFVIDAAVSHAKDAHAYLLIEATCNQVNQEGGYTGMRPNDFIASLNEIAGRHQFPRERLILGGDHLGPNPWRAEPAQEAMEKARLLVKAYVMAGFSKIHLDASMKCAGDAPKRPLEPSISANRAADLALAAESAHADLPQGSVAPRYVIGTEVPIPGGTQVGEEELAVTTPEDAADTIELTRRAFYARGLEAAWDRVIAMVVQPGVEFGDGHLFEYRRERATSLAQFIKENDQLLFEAHSTDYQKREGLRALVEDQFGILKVGPWLTFAFREAVFALAMMERELFSGRRSHARSDIRDLLEQAMLDNPTYWEPYYSGDSSEQRFSRSYSFSDRSRYYWSVPAVKKALATLLENLELVPLPLTLLSQYAPVQYEKIRSGSLVNSPRAIIRDKIGSVLSNYRYACELR